MKKKTHLCPRCRQHKCGRIPKKFKSKGGMYKLEEEYYPICWWCKLYEKNPELLNFNIETPYDK